ncbi:hypothetical protein OGZ01_30755 (plasmid) [Vibrio harveyi]|nr:hypothetical protein [Vibrio harveyi]
MNPFELITNWKEEEDGVVSIVKAMASEKGLLDEYQLAGLKQIMNELWEVIGSDMTVDHIADKCCESDEQRIKDIGQQLYAFTSKGSYGSYFSGSNNVNFQNRFTVLELDELQGYRKHLRQVVLLQMIYQIQQEMFLGERNRKKVVIIDEAWDLLKEGEVSTFLWNTNTVRQGSTVEVLVFVLSRSTTCMKTLWVALLLRTQLPCTYLVRQKSQ